jgi:hypothetical protein
VSQLQQAAQSDSTAQAIGSAAELANALETQAAPASTSPTTSTITQIQVGCLSACFGAAMSDPSSAALAQLLLSELSSLQAPPESSGLQPVPAVLQNVVQQAVCQIQQTSGVGTQVETASQTSATFQVAPILPADLGPTQPAGSIVDQTQQQIWQLQIGCLFYCVDSEQVQQAQQSTTTIQILPGPAGSSSVVVVQQTIWQVQIGCLASCWNSTQLQEASTQTTIAVGAVPTSGDGPQVPGSPDPPPEPPAPPPAPSGSPEPGPASSGAAPATGATAAVRLIASSGKTGLAILETRLVARTVTPTSAVASANRAAPAGGRREARAETKPEATIAVASTVAAAHPRGRHRSDPGRQSTAAIVAKPTLSAASGGGEVPIIALLLALATAGSLVALREAHR